MSIVQSILEKASDIVAGRRNRPPKEYQRLVDEAAAGQLDRTPEQIADFLIANRFKPEDLADDVAAKQRELELEKHAATIPELKAKVEAAGSAVHDAIQQAGIERKEQAERHRDLIAGARADLDEARGELASAVEAAEELKVHRGYPNFGPTPPGRWREIREAHRLFGSVIRTVRDYGTIEFKDAEGNFQSCRNSPLPLDTIQPGDKVEYHHVDVGTHVELRVIAVVPAAAVAAPVAEEVDDVELIDA